MFCITRFRKFTSLVSIIKYRSLASDSSNNKFYKLLNSNESYDIHITCNNLKNTLKILPAELDHETCIKFDTNTPNITCNFEVNNSVIDIELNGVDAEESKNKSGDKCVLNLPMNPSALKVNLDDCNLDIQEMKPQILNVISAQGNILTKNLKFESGSILAKDGDITCDGYIEGDLLLENLYGDINSQKIGGNNLTVILHYGRLNVSAIYSNNSIFDIKSGYTALTHLHKDTKINIYMGDLYIKSLDGNLKLNIEKAGNIQIDVADVDNICDIRTNNGNIKLGVQNIFKHSMKLTARHVSFPICCPSFRSAVDKSNSELVEYTKNNTNNDNKKKISAFTKSGKILLMENSWIQAFTGK